MKGVLISIQPKWVEEICHKIGELNGKPIYKKRIEVRKGRPKEKLPIKCFIYEIYDKKYDGIGVCWEKGNIFEHACKKVIGEFVCDGIDEFIPSEYGVEALHETSLTVKEMREYLQGKTGYGWHITDLKIYDKPKELSEFLIDCKNCGKKFVGAPNCWQGCVNGYRRLTRPPQSWCYVEEL